jgi:MFS family permease
MLVVTRALLGLAGATVAPSTLSLIRNMFHDERQRTRAISIWITAYSLGGAIARVPESATSFGGRGATWLVAAGGAWDDASADSAARDWIERLHTAVADDATGIGYVNMLAGERPAHSAWTRARLRAVKAAWTCA